MVDLDCGDGRDVIAFAAAGRQVFGIDTAPQAIIYATARAERMNLPAARFEVPDARQIADLTAVSPNFAVHHRTATVTR